MSRMGSYLAAHESLLDFGARFYDPATAIFLQQDPRAEKYYHLSPDAYCANNPVTFVDPDGRISAPVVGALIGAAIGASVSATSAIIAGRSGSEVFAAAVGGAVDGGVSTIAILSGKPALGKAITGTLGGSLGNAVEQSLNIVFGNQEQFDKSSVVVDGVVGGVMAGGSEVAQKHLKSLVDGQIYSESTSKGLEKNIKQDAKGTEKKLKPSAVDNLVEVEQKAMSEAASTTIDVSFKTFGYSYNFYKGVYGEEK